MELMLFEDFVNNNDFSYLRESLSREINFLQNIDESEIDLLNEGFLKNINQVADAFFTQNDDVKCWKTQIKDFIAGLLGTKKIQPQLLVEMEKLLSSNKYYGFMSTC